MPYTTTSNMKSMVIHPSGEIGGALMGDDMKVDAFWSYQIPILATLLLSIAVTTVSSIGLHVAWGTAHAVEATQQDLNANMALMTQLYNMENSVFYHVECSDHIDPSDVTVTDGTDPLALGWVLIDTSTGQYVANAEFTNKASLDPCERAYFDMLVATGQTTTALNAARRQLTASVLKKIKMKLQNGFNGAVTAVKGVLKKTKTDLSDCTKGFLASAAIKDKTTPCPITLAIKQVGKKTFNIDSNGNFITNDGNQMTYDGAKIVSSADVGNSFIGVGSNGCKNSVMSKCAFNVIGDADMW